MHNEDLIKYVSMVDELVAVNDFLNEDFVEESLSDLVKLAVKPDVPVDMTKKLIVKMQSMSGIFAIKATYYATLNKGRSGTDEFNKKNIYYTLADVFDKIANALKYLARREYGV